MQRFKSSDEDLPQLTAEECLSLDVVRVLKEDSPKVVSPQTIFAVFDRSTDHGRLCGLVAARDIEKGSDLIFADLISSDPVHSVVSYASILESLYVLQQESVPVLSVVDVFGHFLGVVTYRSILGALQERELPFTERSSALALQPHQGQQKKEIAHQRLAELVEASRFLLDNLNEVSSEFDLMNICLGVLRKLIPSRYLAIGVFDESGTMVLKHFLTVGMSEEEIATVGDKPKGTGLLGVVIKDNIPLVIDDMSKDPRSVGFPPNHPIMKSLLAMPISQDGRAYGRIYLCDKIDGTIFSEEDSLLLQNFAHSMSMALNRTRELEEIRISQKAMDYKAHFDSLTGLPNRALLFDRIQQAIRNARRTKVSVVVMFIDLDNFKQINDSFGHVVGDAVLKMAGARISKCVRETDTVARLGGDEFILLLPEATDAQGSAKVARKILESMSEPFHLDGHKILVTASIGVSMHGPLDDMSIEEFLQTSDKAMYRAKKLGRNNYQFSDNVIDILAKNQTILGRDLRHVLEKNELVIHYQPQIHVESLQVVGMEALVRWQSEEFGLISPRDFIPLAEEIGMIGEISRWVLRTACLQGRAWHDAGTPVRIGVNLSGKEFQPQNLQHTVEMILNVLGETKFQRNLLDLELTEGILIPHLVDLQDSLVQIRTEGIHLSLDDFGTGYSSLNYLKQLPIDTIKIDRIFVRDIVSNPDSASIVKALLSLAHEMHLDTVAEGVETREQMQFLQALGCDIMQGFYFSEPLSTEKATQLLQSGTSKSLFTT